jgi:uncharacterized protein (DUF1330 family)
MTAFVIARVDVTDPVRYEDYKALTPRAVAQFGGHFIVRGGQTETLEGEPETRRVVVIEFADMDTARAFYHSEAYGGAKAKRAGAAEMQIVVVDGTD